MAEPSEFQYDASFEQGEIAGNVHLGKFEAQYEEIFAEVIEDGIITAEERARLDRAADSLGLDRARLRRLEQALQLAYEARHQVKIRDLSSAPAAGPPVSIRVPTVPLLDDDEPRPSLRLPPVASFDANVMALQQRISFLESRVAELEQELKEARSQVAVEVDLSDVRAAPPAAVEEDPADLMRRVRHDPRDTDAMRALFKIWGRRGDPDRQFCAAQALVVRGAAGDDERRFFQQHRPEGLIRPSTSVSSDAWRRLLFHPDEEVLTGEIFSIIVSAVLLGRVSALRRDKALPQLDPATRQEPQKSTLQAVRCFSWASSLLGMTAPALYAVPQLASAVEMVPGLPPCSRLGKAALSGRSASELAFLAGRHLSWYREEHFVRLLVPSIPDLEDLFLSALLVGNPNIPLSADMKRRVTPLAKAIEPILEPILIDRLRGYFLRFVEEGGRTNLQRWANAANLTASRAGFLLCGDFDAARAVLAIEDPSTVDLHIDDLVVFVTSDRYANLRKQIGVAIR